MNFIKEGINKMKLEDCVDINKVTVSQVGEQVAYDTETTYYGLSQRKIAVSSKVPLANPCDICHREVTQLFTLCYQGLTYFACHSCYIKRYRSCGKVVRSFVNPSTLTINTQPEVDWDEICTTAERFVPRLYKIRKKNRKRNKL